MSRNAGGEGIIAPAQAFRNFKPATVPAQLAVVQLPVVTPVGQTPSTQGQMAVVNGTSMINGVPAANYATANARYQFATAVPRPVAATPSSGAQGYIAPQPAPLQNPYPQQQPLDANPLQNSLGQILQSFSGGGGTGNARRNNNAAQVTNDPRPSSPPQAASAQPSPATPQSATTAPSAKKSEAPDPKKGDSNTQVKVGKTDATSSFPKCGIGPGTNDVGLVKKMMSNVLGLSKPFQEALVSKSDSGTDSSADMQLKIYEGPVASPAQNPPQKGPLMIGLDIPKKSLRLDLPATVCLENGKLHVTIDKNETLLALQKNATQNKKLVLELSPVKDASIQVTQLAGAGEKKLLEQPVNFGTGRAAR